MMATFYPVIHAYDSSQVYKNTFLAKTSEADGVFLINHGRMSEEDFFTAIEQTVLEFQDETFYVGVNFLDKHNAEALHCAAELGCKMLWSDNAMTDEKDLDEALGFSVSQTIVRPYVEFYGGVQFKYQPKPPWDITTSIQRAIKYVEYPTLSGPGTGKEADIEFIKQAYQAANGVPLAIASGISAENVELYLPYIQVFLVASSIIDSESENESFDEDKLKELVTLIHTYDLES